LGGRLNSKKDASTYEGKSDRRLVNNDIDAPPGKTKTKDVE